VWLGRQEIEEKDMTMRYFAKQGAGGVAINIYRFEVGKERITEDYWTKTGWKHDQDAEVAGYLALGEGDFSEVSESVAREIFPEAFLNGLEVEEKRPQFFKIPKDAFSSDKKLDAVAKSIATSMMANSQVPSTEGRRLNRYEVVFSGSSIIGILDGVENYKKCHEFLEEKSKQGKLKCFVHWCEQCKVIPMKKGVDPSLHVVKISFPNVIKLLDGSKVQWRWKEAESEFAKSKGNPGKHFQSLVDANSKPNWVVKVSKSETGIEYRFN
jgi:hypothetical protein